jgi:hypothetical protein
MKPGTLTYVMETTTCQQAMGRTLKPRAERKQAGHEHRRFEANVAFIMEGFAAENERQTALDRQKIHITEFDPFDGGTNWTH